MTYSEPTQLAILACPGGETFANETIKHLNHIYSRRFRQKSDVLAKRYEVDRVKLVKDVNFYNDLQLSLIHI